MLFINRILTLLTFLHAAPPRLSLHPGPLHVKQGDNVTLPVCHVTGYPKPIITWRRVSGRVPPGRSNAKDGTLKIQAAQKSDSDTYICQASNLLGSASATTLLVVVGLPRFSQKPPVHVFAVEGKTVVLNCSAEGDPQPVISWKRQGGQLPAGRTVVTDKHLTIQNTKKEDAGTYVCTATSAAIFDVDAIIRVQVEGG